MTSDGSTSPCRTDRMNQQSQVSAQNREARRNRGEAYNSAAGAA
jgi:hypothetical protein